jgi:cysteine desulfurase / selenocysteine lyase
MALNLQPVSGASRLNDWAQKIVGLEGAHPLLDGRLERYINLDNAATTPPHRDVVDAVLQFLPYYSSVHRGSGLKARVSTAAYAEAHATVARFVGAATDTNTVIFGKNTTEAINKLSYRYPLPADAVVLSTLMEHHSNDLPWRRRARVVRAGVTGDGRLDEADVDRLFERYGNRVALLTISGASNVTGFVQPIHRLARKAHEHGVRILVDAAQLAPHRRLDVKRDDDPEHLDFVALSAHKMYAPFGTGALVGARDVFLHDGPEYAGGGTIRIVTSEDVVWGGLPDREEAGSPNAVGAIAMAAAARVLMDTGMAVLQRHESSLVSYALERLRSVPGIRIYGEADPQRVDDRVGVITFNIDGLPHALVAAILGHEGGIGVRSGCFCAQPYVAHLLAWSNRDWFEALSDGRPHKPGMVRISLGAYNTAEDLDALVEMLVRIVRREFQGKYRPAPETDEYVLDEPTRERVSRSTGEQDV